MISICFPFFVCFCNAIPLQRKWQAVLLYILREGRTIFFPVPQMSPRCISCPNPFCLSKCYCITSTISALCADAKSLAFPNLSDIFFTWIFFLANSSHTPRQAVCSLFVPCNLHIVFYSTAKRIPLLFSLAKLMSKGEISKQCREK